MIKFMTIRRNGTEVLNDMEKGKGERSKEKRSKYKYFSVKDDTFEGLESERDKKSKEIGFELSWDNFFAMLLKEFKGKR